MDLAHPGADLFGETRARILWQFHEHERAYSGRGLQVETGLAQRSVLRALDSLIEVGLIESTPDGAANSYRLNSAHILWPFIRSILESGIRVKDLMARSATRVSSGSATLAGYAHPGAQGILELLVIWRRLPQHRDASIAAFRDEIGRMIGNPLHITELSVSELTQRISTDAASVDRWTREYETLTSGLSLRTLVREIRAGRADLIR